MDEILPFTFLDALLNSLYAFGSLVLPSILNPWVTIPAISSVVVFLLMARYYLRSARDLRRMEAVNRSPVLSHFSETLEGLVHIRAFKKEKRFLEALYRYVFTEISTFSKSVGFDADKNDENNPLI